MNRGDVVELDWPFSDLTGSKRRPAVVIQADFLTGLIDDTILIKITSRRFGIPGTEVEIDPSIEFSSGLTKPLLRFLPGSSDPRSRPHTSDGRRAFRRRHVGDRSMFESDLGVEVRSKRSTLPAPQ